MLSMLLTRLCRPVVSFLQLHASREHGSVKEKSKTSELMERMMKVQAAESGWAQAALSPVPCVPGWNSLFREIRGSG
jgi:hypothetical protein